jgi:hypothetical protein
MSSADTPAAWVVRTCAGGGGRGRVGCRDGGVALEVGAAERGEEGMHRPLVQAMGDRWAVARVGSKGRATSGAACHCLPSARTSVAPTRAPQAPIHPPVAYPVERHRRHRPCRKRDHEVRPLWQRPHRRGELLLTGQHIVTVAALPQVCELNHLARAAAVVRARVKGGGGAVGDGEETVSGG